MMIDIPIESLRLVQPVVTTTVPIYLLYTVYSGTIDFVPQQFRSWDDAISAIRARADDDREALGDCFRNASLIIRSLPSETMFASVIAATLGSVQYRITRVA